MTTVWRLEALGPMAALKAVGAALDETDPAPALGWSLFEDGDPDRGRLDVLMDGAPSPEALDAFLTDYGLRANGVETAFGPLPETDWVRLSLEGLPPVEAGRFVIHGAHEPGPGGPDVIPIQVEAGPAFGTGHHGTTKGCLLALDRLTREGFRPKTILDLGCGTGVLAIAAAKLWPGAAVLASDIDADATAETRYNVDHNGAGPIEVIRADGFDHPRLAGARFDLVIANILAGPLRDLAPAIAQALEPGGRLILSGLLDAQAQAITARYGVLGFDTVAAGSLEGWASLTLARP